MLTRYSLILVSAGWTALTAVTSLPVLAQPAIRFDLAPLAVARAVEPTDSVSALPGQQLVRIPLRISALVDSPRKPQVDQVMVQIYCVDPAASVVDYAPRTELASPFEGNLEVQQTEEKNKHLGFSVNGNYGHLVNGNVGGDVGKKDIESVKYQRVAPLEVVAASGTLVRGRGVYFKLRATALQVLEGDKQFEVVLSVPVDWQAGLLEVRISADRVKKSFGSIEPETQCVGRAEYVVAAFVDDQPRVRKAALGLVESEALLRQAATQFRRTTQQQSQNLFRHFVSALDLVEPEIQDDWLHQVMRGTVDPHLHRDIRKLPVDLRVAILDYQAAQRAFLSAASPDEQTLASQ